MTIEILDQMPEPSSLSGRLMRRLGSAAGVASRVGESDFARWLFGLAYMPLDHGHHLEPADGQWIRMALQRQGRRWMDAAGTRLSYDAAGELAAAWSEAIAAATELELSR